MGRCGNLPTLPKGGPGENIFEKGIDKSIFICYNVGTTNERN